MHGNQIRIHNTIHMHGQHEHHHGSKLFAKSLEPLVGCIVEDLVRLLRGYQFGGMPGFVNCPGTDPLGGGDWRRHCSNLAWSEALQFLSIFAPVYNAYSWMPSSHQPGWLEQM